MVGKLAEVKHCKAQKMLRGTECCSGWSSSLRDPAGHQGQRNRKANKIVAEYERIAKRRLQEKAEAGHVAMQRREMKIICASEAGGGAIPSQAAQDGAGGAQTAFGAAGRNLGG